MKISTPTTGLGRSLFFLFLLILSALVLFLPVSFFALLHVTFFICSLFFRFLVPPLFPSVGSGCKSSVPYTVLIIFNGQEELLQRAVHFSVEDPFRKP
jgi:hypothetical protein